MLLIKSPTSPFGRLAHIALMEAGFDDLNVESVDPWSDPAALLDRHPSRRVPLLVTDDGYSISESLLIVQYAAQNAPAQTDLFQSDASVLEVLALSVGILELSVNVLISRKASTGNPMDTAFDQTEMGARRFQTIHDLMIKLNALSAKSGPAFTERFAGIAAVIALQYAELRFPEASWESQVPSLKALSQTLSQRDSVAATRFV